MTVFEKLVAQFACIALTLALTVGTSAQTGEPEPLQGDAQMPTLETYQMDNIELPEGLERLDVYGQQEESKPALETYDSKPAPPSGEKGPQPPPAPSNWDIESLSEDTEGEDDGLDTSDS